MFIQQLISNLKSQAEMHLVLLEVLKQENQLKASCSLPELTEILSTRDLAAGRIFELERNRIQLIKSFKKENNTDKDISLEEIIKNCNPKEQKILQDLKAELKTLIAKIKSTVKKNAEKAIARITCFTEIQGALDKSFKQHTIYSIDGSVKQSKNPYTVRNRSKFA